MAALRIRKAFRYPDDSDKDDNGREELDEQEQEQLINELKRKNDEQNARYNVIFTCLPLVAAFAYLPGVLSTLETRFQLSLSLLAVLSLLMTTYTMRFIPSKRNNLKRTGHLSNSGSHDITTLAERFLVTLNTALCLFLTLMALIGSSDHPTILNLVPGLILGITLVARQTMLSVDIGQLEGSRYEYKGA